MNEKRQLKPLKPSMREKKRYLLIYGENLIEDIENSIFEYIGVLGMSKVGLNFIKIEKNRVIISINRESLNLVRASFCLCPRNIEIKRVSGSIKGLNLQ